MINGKNPNLPSKGNQTDWVINFKKVLFSNTGKDFNTNPNPIAKGKRRIKAKLINIHVSDTFSFVVRSGNSIDES